MLPDRTEESIPETRNPRAVIEAAERAANAGDFASAEQLLREAALLQEATLGPLHPDLANTLNNLGIVCEIAEKPTNAEHFFRRAYAIAQASLEPGHPFLATSRKNLADFCAARGKPVDLPGPAPVAHELRAPAVPVKQRPVERPIERPPAARPSNQEAQPPASDRWSRKLAIGGLIAGGLFLVFITTTTWFGSTDRNWVGTGNPGHLTSESGGDGAPCANRSRRIQRERSEH